MKKKKKCFTALGKWSRPNLTLGTGTCSHSAGPGFKTDPREDKAFLQGFLTSRALNCEKLAWDLEGYSFFRSTPFYNIAMALDALSAGQAQSQDEKPNPCSAQDTFGWDAPSDVPFWDISFHSQWRGITSFRNDIFLCPSWSDELSLLQLQAVQWWPHVRKEPQKHQCPFFYSNSALFSSTHLPSNTQVFCTPRVPSLVMGMRKRQWQVCRGLLW